MPANRNRHYSVYHTPTLSPETIPRDAPVLQSRRADHTGQLPVLHRNDRPIPRVGVQRIRGVSRLVRRHVQIRERRRSIHVPVLGCVTDTDHQRFRVRVQVRLVHRIRVHSASGTLFRKHDVRILRGRYEEGYGNGGDDDTGNDGQLRRTAVDNGDKTTSGIVEVSVIVCFLLLCMTTITRVYNKK